MLKRKKRKSLYMVNVNLTVLIDCKVQWKEYEKPVVLIIRSKTSNTKLNCLRNEKIIIGLYKGLFNFFYFNIENTLGLLSVYWLLCKEEKIWNV